VRYPSLDAGAAHPHSIILRHVLVVIAPAVAIPCIATRVLKAEEISAALLSAMPPADVVVDCMSGDWYEVESNVDCVTIIAAVVRRILLESIVMLLPRILDAFVPVHTAIVLAVVAVAGPMAIGKRELFAGDAKNKLPLYSTAPASAVVFKVPLVNLIGALDAVADPAARCSFAVGVVAPPI